MLDKVMLILQLFGLISSMLLFCTVRHKRTSHTYKSYDPTTWLLREGDEYYRRCQPLWGTLGKGVKIEEPFGLD